MDDKTNTAQAKPALEELAAADAFVQTIMVPRADQPAYGPYPMWYGWALRDAFYAGAKFARSQAPSNAQAEAPPEAVASSALLDDTDKRR